ncbi:MAG: hypothetical protein J5659_01520 [Clostridia bacterium]|nr:hypothetical protein [Clostridia bacterium]
MKNTKKIVCLLLVLCFCFAFAACHKKNETAVKVGSLKFSSGYYACVLFFTDSQARSKVEEELTDKGESTENINYYKHKIDGKSYVKWVEEETIKTIKKIAACKLYCKENELKLGEDEAQMKSYAEYYWDQGYSQVLIENGVSKETYVKYMTDLSYEDLYFNHIYGAEGEEAISAEKLSEELSENYAVADMLDVDFSSISEDEKTTKTEQLKGYVEDLTKGTRTFEEIYHEFNGDEHNSDEEEAGDDTTAKPLDSHATFIGNKDTDYSNDYFDDIYAMETNAVKIIDKKDDAGQILVVKKDVMEDPYYLSNYDTVLRHSIADDDFDKKIEKDIKKLGFKEYKRATGRFNVKKIYYPETQQSQQQEQ